MTEVRIDGLGKLRRELKKIDAELPKEMNRIAKQAAELVADEAKIIVPHLTGRLGSAIKAGGTAKGGYVKVGKVPYAKPIHFGWPRHNITPSPFLYDARDSRRAEVIDTFKKGLADLIDKSITRGVD